LNKRGRLRGDYERARKQDVVHSWGRLDSKRGQQPGERQQNPATASTQEMETSLTTSYTLPDLPCLPVLH